MPFDGVAYGKDALGPSGRLLKLIAVVALVIAPLIA